MPFVVQYSGRFQASMRAASRTIVVNLTFSILRSKCTISCLQFVPMGGSVDDVEKLNDNLVVGMGESEPVEYPYPRMLLPLLP